MAVKKYKLYLGGKWVDRKDRIEVTNPYSGKKVYDVAKASKADFTKAIDAAEAAFKKTRELHSYERERILLQISEMIDKNKTKHAEAMAAELGKSLKDSMTEVERAVGVFKASAEEAKRLNGDIVDLDWSEGSEERFGLVRRYPKGVLAGISPFNFPLNLVAHKVGPAIASGNTIIIKPASNTPVSALMLAEVIDKTDLPKGAVSVLPASASDSSPLLEDERVKLITFTGSAKVGWWIKQNAGKKEVVLELGGNAGVAIADDADLEWAAQRVTKGSFSSAGQSCISVQRVFVHEKVYDKFLKMFTANVKKLKVGDPLDPNTDIGSMVDKASAEETLKNIEAAKKQGAKVVTGGKLKGAQLEPTVLTDTKLSMTICSEEAFAPIVNVMKYKSFEKVVDEINATDYGLQMGCFTNRMKDIMYAFKYIESGGIVINDVPTYRADHQPYGGMKDSGLKREGIRYTIEDMTDIKILSVNMKYKQTQ